MYSQILVATDGSETAIKAVTQAGTLAKAVGSKLTIVTVTEQAPTFAGPEIGWSLPPSIYDDIRRSNVEESRKVLAAAVALAGYPAATIHVENRAPYQGILDTAHSIGAELIIVGSHGRRGIERLILGSEAAKVLSLADMSVLVVRG